MNTQQHDLKDKLQVMQAFFDGKPTECWNKATERWERINNPSWNWKDISYRLAPPPPVKMVKKWQWIVTSGSDMWLTDCFYSKAEADKKLTHVHTIAPWTEIEVPE